MPFGYVRVSAKFQYPNSQIDALLKEGILERKIYKDVSSGVEDERRHLNLMMGKLREGNTIIVWKLDRIARSISHLLKLVDGLNIFDN